MESPFRGHFSRERESRKLKEKFMKYQEREVSFLDGGA